VKLISSVFRLSKLQKRILSLFVIIIVILAIITNILFDLNARSMESDNMYIQNILITSMMMRTVESSQNVLQYYKGTGSRNYISQLLANREQMVQAAFRIDNSISDERINTLVDEIKLTVSEYARVSGMIIFEQENQPAVYFMFFKLYIIVP